MTGHSCIQAVCERIVGAFSPQKIFLFSMKKSTAGEVRSFKLCVVVETQDKEETEKRIYLDIDCEIPYDVLVYTPEEWESNLNAGDSFASRISKEGQCIYDSGKK